MEDEQRTWTSEEALANLESLTRLEWDREKLTDGVRELLDTYEAAIPQLSAEIRHLRSKQREKPSKDSDEKPQGEGSGSTDGYEDLAEFARRLGLEQK